jgi:phosphate-selective porin OprO/OprP
MLSVALLLGILTASSSTQTTPSITPSTPTTPSMTTTPSTIQPSDGVQWSAAPGDGVTIKASDGSWSLNARARLQLRAAFSSDPTADDVDDRLAAEFMVRRARLALKGMLFHDRVQWGVQLGMSPNDVESDRPIIVRDAWVQWNAPWGIGLQVGQMKVPFDRQRLVSSSAMQFADRARLINELTLDRDIGVQLRFTDLLGHHLGLQAGLFGGDGRNRPTPNAGFLSVVRVQMQPLGPFDDLVEGDLDRRETPALAIAAAVASSTRTTRVLGTTGRVLASDGSDGLLDYGHATIDAVFKWKGASLFVAGLGRVGLVDHGAPAPIARSAVGAVVQAGVMTIGGLELVARAAHTQPFHLEGLAANDPTLVPESEASVGFNLYGLGHDFKLNTDVGAVAPAGSPVRAFGRTQVQVFF